MNYNHELMASAWRSFIEKGEILPAVPPHIKDSWLRCRAMGLDPIKPIPGHREARDPVTLYEQSRELLEASAPVLELLRKLTAGTGFCVVLTNASAEVLEVMGDADIVEMARSNNYVPGASRAEEAVGTNAIGLVCKLQKPIQVVGYEHYHINHHPWSCAAAPIKDAQGQFRGVLCLSGHYYSLQEHTLGLVVAAALSIERDLLLRRTHESFSKNNRLLESIIESMENGLLVTDHSGIIIKANNAISRLVGIPEEKLVGKHLKDIISNPKLGSWSEVLSRFYTYQECYLAPRGAHNYNIPVFIKATPLRDDKEDLLGTVFTIEERRTMHRMAQRIAGFMAHFTFDDIIARNPKMMEAVELAKTAATTNCRILIHGESGVGKELFAQAIHNASPRRYGPFVAINCAAIPRELIESELFGYEEGAFTGAKRGGKPGRLELAHRGTLFLDEVNSMPLDMQVKLLRFLQEGTFTRVGGTELISVDVRVISATNRPLEEEMNIGNFRSDLYYRLSTVVINIPPLRERPEDLEALVNYILNRKSAELNKRIIRIRDDTWDLLISYHWPGNVRELENVIERAVILASGEEITPAELPSHFQSMTGSNTSEQTSKSTSFLSRAEKEAIQAALIKTAGNISKAARLLGITRATLYKKMRIYNIQKPTV